MHAAAQAGVYSQGVCYPDSATAGARACANFEPVSNGGATAYCNGSMISRGGKLQVAIQWTDTSRAAYAVDVPTAECELRDWTYLGPIVALFTVTMISLACSKAIRRMFTRETY